MNRVRSTTTWLIAFAVCVLSPWTAWAQTPAPRAVEFDDAVQQAVARNPTLAGAQTAIARADALLQQARAALLPSLVASVNNVTYNAARGFEGTVTQPQSQVIFGATASMSLFAPEARARVTQERDQVDVATLATAEVRQQIAVAAAHTYLGVVAARRQIEVNARALDASRAHLDFAQKRFEGGAGSRLNQLRAAQAVARDEAQLENAAFALRRSQEALGVLLADEGPIDVGAEPALEVPASASQIDWLAVRPDVRLQTRSVEAAQRVVDDSWKAWLPVASLSFSPQLVAPASLFSPARTWQLSIGVSQRLFDRRPAADRALRQVALSQALFVRDEVVIRARSEVRLAQQAVESYERALAAARRAAEQAEEVLRITTAAFEVGATTNIEVIDAQRSARDADTAVAIAEDATRRARLDLLVATGQFK